MNMTTVNELYYFWVVKYWSNILARNMAEALILSLE